MFVRETQKCARWFLIHPQTTNVSPSQSHLCVEITETFNSTSYYFGLFTRSCHSNFGLDTGIPLYVVIMDPRAKTTDHFDHIPFNGK